MDNGHALPKHRYELSYRGEQIQNEQHSPTWRIELLSEDGKITDIWDECWFDGKSWVCSNKNVCETLNDALAACFKNQMLYLGIEEED